MRVILIMVLACEVEVLLAFGLVLLIHKLTS